LLAAGHKELAKAHRISAALLRKRSGSMPIIRNAKFRILPPQPASPVSTGPHAKACQNRAVSRHLGVMRGSPCPEFKRRSANQPYCLRGCFSVSRFAGNGSPHSKSSNCLSASQSAISQYQGGLGPARSGLDVNSIIPVGTNPDYGAIMSRSGA